MSLISLGRDVPWSCIGDVPVMVGFGEATAS